MSRYKDMSDEFLRNNYIPDVYQKSIFAIDFEKWKQSGIRVISFDIDDTIAALEKSGPSKAAITLFENLRNMGFELILITNARETRGQHFGEALGVDYIARAQKPQTKHFQEIQDKYGVEKSQMAHVGNSTTNDVAGGKAFGITTCLVRNIGIWEDLRTKIPGKVKKTEGQKIRIELKERKLWRKHHKYKENDQYYQLGEKPAYMEHK